MIRGAMLFIIMLCEVSAAMQRAPNGSAQSICRGLGGLPQWGVKLVANHHVRFTIDALLVDNCTEYFDLEFVADLGFRVLTSKR